MTPEERQRLNKLKSEMKNLSDAARNASVEAHEANRRLREINDEIRELESAEMTNEQSSRRIKGQLQSAAVEHSVILAICVM